MPGTVLNFTCMNSILRNPAWIKHNWSVTLGMDSEIPNLTRSHGLETCVPYSMSNFLHPILHILHFSLLMKWPFSFPVTGFLSCSLIFQWCLTCVVGLILNLRFLITGSQKVLWVLTSTVGPPLNIGPSDLRLHCKPSLSSHINLSSR